MKNSQNHFLSKSYWRGLLRGKTRIALAWLFGAVLVFSARNYPELPGIFVCFLGASLRYWASGFLRKDTRPAVGGPYAFVRNPLYLGTYLMAVGTALAIMNIPLLIVITILFAIVYHFIILDEEEKLETIFGKPYQLYKKTVPRFFPLSLTHLPFFPAPRKILLQINPEEDHLYFSLKLANKNKAYEAYVSFVALIGIVGAVAHFWQNLG